MIQSTAPCRPSAASSVALSLRVMLVVTALLLAAGSSQAARFALLVGNASGGSDEAQLKYVENDISGMRRVLVNVCGFDKQDVATLYNGTVADLDAAIAAMTQRIGQSQKNDLVLFYYSGHADDKSLKLGDERYELAVLKTRFAGVPAEIRIGVFDACQSGSITRLKGGKLAEPFLFLSDDKVRGQVILSSSSASESSQESDAFRNSVFTFHLVNALRGSADATGDARVTLGEAYQYAYNHTLATTARSGGGAQHPGYQFSIQGEGEIVLADLNVRTSGILLGADVTGEITIVDDKRSIVADLNKQPRVSTMIALAEGTYQVTRRNPDGAQAATADVTGGRVVTINAGAFQSVDDGAKPRTKGSASARTHVDICASLGYELLGLSSVSDELTRRFAGFSIFGMSPGFWVPKGRVTGTGGFEVWVKDALQLTASVGHYSFSHDWSWQTNSNDPVTGASQNYALSVNQNLDIWTVYTGPGIKVRTGPLRNLTLHAGLQSYLITHTLRSRFVDSLYNVESTTSSHESGMLVLPVLGAAYRYSILPALDAGVMVRYRFQKAPGKIGDGQLDDQDYYWMTAAEPGFRYGLGGIDGRVFLCYRFGRN